MVQWNNSLQCNMDAEHGRSDRITFMKDTQFHQRQRDGVFLNDH
jgi:hypothetical protein